MCGDTSNLLRYNTKRRVLGYPHPGTQAPSPFNQAVLVVRWFLDATRVRQLTTDNHISGSTALLESALLAAKMAGHGHISIDGTLIETDRCRTPGPPPAWTCGGRETCQPWRERPGHHRPDGWPPWASDVRPAQPRGGELTEDQKAHNKADNGKRAVGERGNSLLKSSFKALRNISLCPWRIGAIVAAALVILHVEHGRTT